MGRRGGPALCGSEVDKHKKQDYRPAIDWLALFAPHSKVTQTGARPQSRSPDLRRRPQSLQDGRGNARTVAATAGHRCGAIQELCQSLLEIVPLSCVHRCGALIPLSSGAAATATGISYTVLLSPRRECRARVCDHRYDA